MKEQIEKKLATLKAEEIKGKQLLSQKNQEIIQVQTSLANIQGAIACLVELLKEETPVI
jgi:hypothetical protein